MATDHEFTHIISGYSAASSIQSSFEIPATHVVKCGDVLSIGQQNLSHDYPTWEQKRQPALAEAWDCRQQDLFEANAEFRLFHNFNALDGNKPVLIWLDCGPNSQLMAAFLCHLFKANGWDLDRLHAIAYAKARELYMGILGVLNEKELQARRPESRKLSKEDIDLYATIWNAFAGTDLKAIVSTCSSAAASALTIGALPLIFRRLPNRLDGLNEIDHDLLKHMIAQSPSAIRAIADSMGHDETPEMVGDLFLFARLKRLGSPHLKHPLVDIENPTGHMRECQIRILPAAHEILEGRANMITLNGLDDWLGGVRLTPDNFVWREDVVKTLGSRIQ